jgi:hypothetical protein
MSKIAHLIEPTLRRRKMKPRRHYADGGASDVGDGIDWSKLNQPTGEASAVQYTPTQRIGNAFADTLMAGGMQPYTANDLTSRIGNVVGASPLGIAGSAMDTIAAKARGDNAGTIMGMAGMIPGAKPEVDATEVALKAIYEALGHEYPAPAAAKAPPGFNLEEEMKALLAAPPAPTASSKPVDIWATDPLGLAPGQAVTAGPGGKTGIFNGVTKAGTVMVDWNPKKTPATAPAPKNVTDETIAAIEKALDNWKEPTSESLPVKSPYSGKTSAPTADPLPETERQAARIAGGYTTPAYRGMKIEGGQGPLPTHAEYSDLYSTADQRLADMYSSYLDMHPGSEGEKFDTAYARGAQVAPLYVNTSEYHHVDAKGAHWSDINPKAIREAKQMGKPGVVVDNVWDEPNSTHRLESEKRIFITFPEGQHTVKSKFAGRFDPTSNNMLRGVGAVGTAGTVGYLAMPGQQQNQARGGIVKADGGQVHMAAGGELPDAPWATASQANDLPDAPWATSSETTGVGADVAKSAGVGVGKGLIDFAGTAGDASNLLAKGSKIAGDYIGGLMGFEPSPELHAPIFPTSAGIQKAVESKTGQFYEPQTTAGKFAGAITETAANPLSYVGPGRQARGRRGDRRGIGRGWRACPAIRTGVGALCKDCRWSAWRIGRRLGFRGRREYHAFAWYPDHAAAKASRRYGLWKRSGAWRRVYARPARDPARSNPPRSYQAGTSRR